MKLMAIAATLAIAICAASADAQVNGDPQGAETLRNYVLTMDKVKGYDAATVAFQAAARNDPRLQAAGRSIMAAQQQSLADLVANFGRHPLVFGFYSRQGLSALDAVALPMVLSNACMADLYPQTAAKVADETSPAQIDFCKGHLREIEALQTFRGAPPPPQQ